MRRAAWAGWAFFLTTSAHAAGDGPLHIEDAVSLALSRNERAKISDLNVTVADAGVDRARAAFLPTLASTGAYQQKPEDVVQAGRNSYALNSAITLSQPILNAAAFPLYAQSKRLLDGQVAQTIDDKRLLAFDAARGFFAVLSAEAVVTAAEKRLNTARANLADAEARVSGGFVGKNDATRSQIEFANATTELKTDKGILAVARINLAFTINSAVPGALEPPTALLAAGRVQPPGPDALIKSAIMHRPDLASKRYLAAAAHDSAEEPLLRLVPTLGVSGTFQLSSDETLLGHGFYNNEFLTATLTWTIFDAGVRYADRRSRVASASIADLTVDTLVRQVDQQLRTAIATLEAAQAALVSAEQARDAAKQSADETSNLYKQGLAKAIELVDANDARFLADTTYASAEYGVALAYLSVRQAIGLDPIGSGFQ